MPRLIPHSNSGAEGEKEKVSPKETESSVDPPAFAVDDFTIGLGPKKMACPSMLIEDLLKVLISFRPLL